MRYTTCGIVLGHIKYQESSSIVRIFTEKLGVQSFFVKNARSVHSRHAMGLFQPLLPLDLVGEQVKRLTLHQLLEVKLHKPVFNLCDDLKKATVAVFLADLVQKCVVEAHEDAKLFNFLLDAVVELDGLKGNYAAFYIAFILSFSDLLGFGCGTVMDLNKQLRDQSYVCLSVDEVALLDHFFKNNVPSLTGVKVETLQNITLALVNFLHLHVGNGLQSLNSLKVLRMLNE